MYTIKFVGVENMNRSDSYESKTQKNIKPKYFFVASQILHVWALSFHRVKKTDEYL